MYIQSQAYGISISKDWQPLIQILSEQGHSKIFILTDENVHQHCLPLLLSNVEKLQDTEVLEVESGEASKSLEICEQLWLALTESGADRHSLLINVGGGVVGDLGGFVASVYKRGMDFIQIPTSLLAQVDASVGGKTGVNFNGLKNQLGCFQNPKYVFIQPEFLKTLPEDHLRSGFAEMVKHALIAETRYWKEIKNIGELRNDISEDLIARSVQIKNEIVEKDPKEAGLRKALNFGHTIGHAVESYFMDKEKLLHGEAIAIGMVAESWLSHWASGLPQSELDEISHFILQHFPKVAIPTQDHSALLQLMQHDKKNRQSQINFTLLEGIGKAKIDRHCEAALIRQALEYYSQIAAA